MEKRKVPAADATTSTKPWKLTPAQWTLYYWLLSHSKWNSFENEPHYFIYKADCVKSKIMKQTGIKSQTTVRTAFSKLEEVGAIADSPFAATAYKIFTPNLYIPMDVSILRCLLGFHKYIDPALLITTFAILARLSRFSKDETISFTKAELGALLGKARQNVDEGGILLVLSLLQGLSLIKLNTKEYTNNLGVRCIRYYLVAAFPEIDLSAYLSDGDEIDNDRLEKMWAMINEEI